MDKNVQKKIDGLGDAWQNEITRKRIVSYKSQCSCIDDIFIYFKVQERVISSNTVASFPAFFDLYGDMDISYEERHEFMRQDWKPTKAGREV